MTDEDRRAAQVFEALLEGSGLVQCWFCLELIPEDTMGLVPVSFGEFFPCCDRCYDTARLGKSTFGSLARD